MRLTGLRVVLFGRFGNPPDKAALGLSVGGPVIPVRMRESHLEFAVFRFFVFDQLMEGWAGFFESQQSVPKVVPTENHGL